MRMNIHTRMTGLSHAASARKKSHDDGNADLDSAYDLVLSGNFEKEVVRSKTPVFVSFITPLSAACRGMDDKIDALADKLKHKKMKAVVIVTDWSQDLVDRYNIKFVPTFAIFDKGKVVAKKVGAMSAKKLAAFVKPYLSRMVHCRG